MFVIKQMTVYSKLLVALSTVYLCLLNFLCSLTEHNHLTPEHISYLSALLSSSLPRAAQGWLARLRPWPAVAKELEQSLKIVFDQCKQHLIDHIFFFFS